MIDWYESRNRGQQIACVLVAIHNTDRTLNFTPTAAESVKGGATRENTGGASNFTRFLREELIPLLEEKYPIGTERLFIGHSFAGLLGSYILQHQTDIFQTYLLFDPSYWWDDYIMLREPVIHSGQKPAVFMAFSGAEEKVLIGDKPFQISSLLQRQISASPFFLKWYAEENHGSILARGLPVALSWYLQKIIDRKYINNDLD